MGSVTISTFEGDGLYIPSPVTRPAALTLYFPLAFFLIYLTFTVALFAFGPWRYPVADGRVLYGFLLLAHLALAGGYLSAHWNVPGRSFSRAAVSRLVKLCLVVALVLLVPTSLLDTGSPIPNVIAGVVHPGVAYARSLQLRSERAFIYVSYIRIVMGPLLFLLLPLLVIYWQDLTNRIRILGLVAVAFGVAISIAEGVNKGLADPLMLFPVLALAAYFSRRLQLSKTRWIVIGVGWLLAAGLFAAYFGSTQATRAGSASAYGSLPAATVSPSPFAPPSPTASPTARPTSSPAPPPSPTAAPTPSLTPSPTAAPTPSLTPSPATYPGGVEAIKVDYGNPIFRVLPRSLRTTAVGATSYVTQGYFALYLSLKEPFVPMFGVGNSLFLTQQAVRITGNPKIADMSYPSRIQKYGWDALGRWSSIYPWIASDVSFPGTIVVVFLIGRFFAIAWFDALSSRNPYAFGMVALFAIMLFYFPANNQTTQFGEGFTAFWGILAAWLLTRNGLVFALATRTPWRRAGLARGASTP